jgi:hypothetical protein
MRFKIFEHVIYLFIGVFSIAVASMAVKSTTTPTTGIVLPAKSVLPATSATSVKVMMSNNLEFYPFTTLGEVHVETHFEELSQAVETNTIEYAKQLAATVGANAIVIEQMGSSTSDAAPKGLSKFFLFGKAIHIDNKLSTAR